MSEGQSGPGSENYYCTVATTSTRPYTPAPALHRPTSSRANSPSTWRARPGGREPRARNPTSHPPSRAITATASASCLLLGWWERRHCTNRRGRFPNNERICAARVPYVVPATRCSRCVFIIPPSAFVLNPPFRGIPVTVLPHHQKKMPANKRQVWRGEMGGVWDKIPPKRTNRGLWGEARVV